MEICPICRQKTAKTGYCNTCNVDVIKLGDIALYRDFYYGIVLHGFSQGVVYTDGSGYFTRGMSARGEKARGVQEALGIAGGPRA